MTRHDVDLDAFSSKYTVEPGDVQDLNIANRFSKYDVKQIPAADRLKLAQQLLLFLGVLTVGIFVGYAKHPKNPALEQIFELFKIGVLPLITLIVSFYFSRTDQ